MKTAEQIKGAIRNISKENKLQRKNLEFIPFYLHLDFCSYEIENVRTKVRLGVKRKNIHCLSEGKTKINK